MSAIAAVIAAACDDPKFGSGSGLARSVARLIGRPLSPAQVSIWASGQRPVNPKYCRALEQLGVAAVWETRPDDWHLIWPERIGSAGAPPAPNTLLKRRRTNAGRTENAAAAAGGQAAQ